MIDSSPGRGMIRERMRTNGPRTHQRTFAVIAVMAIGGLCGWGLAIGCTFPEYTTDLVVDSAPATDSGKTETVTEVADTAPYVLPDGRVCTGHDEDHDGVPDECDNCPNVANADQSGGAIGDGCKPSSAFIPAPVRLLFDPYTSLGSWTSFGTGNLFELDGDRDSLVGGTKSDNDLRYVVGKTGAGASAIVITSVITLREEGDLGSAGIIVRVTSDKRFYICAISSVNGFAAARAPDTGCTGGPCDAVVTFALPNPDGGTAIPAQFSFPPDVPHAIGDPIGLRVSVSGGTTGDAGGGGEFECRVFDPKKPTTLLSSDTRYSVKITVGASKWLSTGEIGAYARRARAQVHSLDVLRGP